MSWKDKTCEKCEYRGKEGGNYKNCLRFPPSNHDEHYNHNSCYPIIGTGSYMRACAEYKEAT